jgi:ankyrin repeat protein
MNGYAPVAALLLADVRDRATADAPNAAGNAPLHVAARQGNYEVVARCWRRVAGAARGGGREPHQGRRSELGRRRRGAACEARAPRSGHALLAR